MYKENSTFAQLLQLVDRLGFDNSVKKLPQTNGIGILQPGHSLLQ